MIDKTEEKFLCVLKNFNEPAVNGTMYNLDAECSKEAIQNFIDKKEVFGELNHPSKEDHQSNDEFLKRLNTVNLENAAVHISDLQFDPDKKQIIGLVKKVGNLPGLFESIQRKELAFGMRSLCHAYKPSEDSPVIHDIVGIITFDIINAITPGR